MHELLINLNGKLNKFMNRELGITINLDRKKFSIMMVWYSFILLLLLSSFFYTAGISNHKLILSFVIIHFLFTSFLLLEYWSDFRWIFILSFILRFFIMCWDLYFQDVFLIPTARPDPDFFYFEAINVSSKSISRILSSNVNFYSKIMGMMFRYVGGYRILGQYINVLLSISIIFIFNKNLEILSIEKKYQRLLLSIYALFPQGIVVSSIFLREMFVTFFISLSVFKFTKWFSNDNAKNMLFTILLIGIAALFHSGVLAIITGYIFAFLFYDYKNQKFTISTRTLIYALLLAFILIGGLFLLGDSLFIKFSVVENLSDVYRVASSARGGAAYLENLKITNVWQLIFFSPIRMIYFWFSPMPWNWRGVLDVIAFILDSLFYLMVILKVIIRRESINVKKELFICLLISLFASSLIFGIGVNNAGTAARHRHKLFSLFLIILSIIIKNKKSLNYYK